MKSRILTTVLTLVALMSIQSVMAWGGLGHSAIAYIAEQHLTDEAKAKCHHYLKHSLAYDSSWMDHWRKVEPFCETSHWHCMKGDRDNKVIDDGRSAPLHIVRICKEMKNYKRLSDEQIAINLKLLIHMAGDMHCPSHVSYPDQGFKRPSLYIKGRKYNGHAVWDASPAYLHPGWTIVDYQRNLDNKSAKQIKQICKGTPCDWAEECILKMRVTGYIFDRNAEFTKMDEATVEKMRRLNDEQILNAGYRLASLLNKMFK